MRLAPMLLLGLASTAALAQGASGPFSVGGRGFGSLQDAINAIGEGEGTIRVASGTYRECAVQNAGRITIAATEPGKAIFTRIACEGKAALVIRGRGATIDGIVFSHIEVADGNGCGHPHRKGAAGRQQFDVPGQPVGHTVGGGPERDGRRRSLDLFGPGP
ncbi:hypothetical protein P0F65_01775 [Sphingomonas sp. I4]